MYAIRSYYERVVAIGVVPCEPRPGQVRKDEKGFLKNNLSILIMINIAERFLVASGTGAQGGCATEDEKQRISAFHEILHRASRVWLD